MEHIFSLKVNGALSITFLALVSPVRYNPRACAPWAFLTTLIDCSLHLCYCCANLPLFARATPSPAPIAWGLPPHSVFLSFLGAPKGFSLFFLSSFFSSLACFWSRWEGRGELRLGFVFLYTIGYSCIRFPPCWFVLLYILCFLFLFTLMHVTLDAAHLWRLNRCFVVIVHAQNLNKILFTKKNIDRKNKEIERAKSKKKV